MGFKLVAVCAALALISQSTKSDALTFKQVKAPLRPMTKSEIYSYAKNKTFLPKLDSVPKGKTAQPESAGKSSVLLSSQIIGGSNAALKQFPWQIYMSGDDSWLCGGSLITPNVVLTAAHCVYGGTTFKVTIGGIERTTNETYERTQVSTKVVIHQNYDDYWTINDIALIILPENYTLNEYVNLIRLPKQSDASLSFAGKTVVASGYGMTANTGDASDVMKFVSLSVITNTRCAAIFGKETVISSCICTGANNTKSICSGDSGGPLVYRESDGKYTQIGVVSFGAASSCTRYPSGYARVTSFLGWISGKTGMKFRP